MMKSHYVLIFFFLLGFVFSSCDQKEVKPERFELDGAIIDFLISDYDMEIGPGAALLITENGNIIYSKGYGLANLEESIPITSATNFRLASLTKQFTAMCIMILNSRGQLDYERTLTDIFPDFPEYGSNITIKHLLHHTSGLIDYFTLIADTVSQQLKDQDVLNLMMAQTTTHFPPGTEYRYSNSGYALLAMIVESVSGKGFADFLEEEIFFPLGMSNSIAFEDGISTVENRAYGYSQIDSEFIRDDQSITSAVLGDGGIYSSLDDMFKWDRILNTEELVPFAILNEAFVSGTLDNGSETGYGFGWLLDSYLYRIRSYHTGSTRGFRNVYMRFPDEKMSIVILTNRNSGSPIEIANQIMEYIFTSNSTYYKILY